VKDLALKFSKSMEFLVCVVSRFSATAVNTIFLGAPVRPEHLNFGGGVPYTVLNPIVAVVVLVAGMLMLLVPRKFMVAPLLTAALLIPMDQVVVVSSFHFQMLRVLILFGWVRMIAAKISSKQQVFSGGINGIDWAVVLLVIFTVVDVTLLWNDSGAFINQVGTLYTVFGIYFLLRFLIRNMEDIEFTLRVLAYVATVVAVVMTIEQGTGRNPYALLGGFRASLIGSLMERDDRFRAMASFSHPILAGTFGATLLPLFLALWFKGKKHHFTAALGMIAATVITLASNSSTPLLAYLATLLGICLWPLRSRMRLIRWGLVTVLVVLHMIMKAPVWALIARVDVVSGSSGYHRYTLVDGFIRHFGDWWLLGTTQNAQWGWDMWDLANQYVAIGESSGLLPFVFFVAIIVLGFKYVGRARVDSRGNKRDQLFFWALGVTMFAHVVAFFGISYFDQTIVSWYVFLSIISASVAYSFQKALSSPVPVNCSGNRVVDVAGTISAESEIAEVLQAYSNAE
jgi:hypothetical protein